MVAQHLSSFFSFSKRAFSISRKIVIVLLVYATIFYLFFYFINKDKVNLSTRDPVKENRTKIYSIINNSKSDTPIQGKIFITLFRSFSCFMMGEACTDNPADGDLNAGKSVVGVMTSVLTIPYAYPPASGVYWAYSGLQNASFIPRSYASEGGIGFAALGGFKQIWLMFRNFMMLLMVLVIVAIGFMIMFRAKINPQTVISIERALPKIVIALLLITFSFAISGFMIDLMYVVIGLIIMMLKTYPSEAIKNINPTDFFKPSVGLGTYMSPFVNPVMIWQIAQSFFNLLPSTLQITLNGVIYSVLGNVLIGAAGATPVGFWKNAGKDVGGLNPVTLVPKVFTAIKALTGVEKIANPIAHSGTVVVSFLVSLIVAALPVIIQSILLPFAGIFLIFLLLFLSLAFIVFRIFFMLISAYLNIIFLIIFSPLILALEAIPGKSTFAPWIKNLATNLLTFPAFILLLFVAKIIVSINPPTLASSIQLNPFAPTQSPFWQPPFIFASFNTQAFQTLLGGLILMSIPNLITALKKALGVKPMELGIGVGSLFTGATTVAGGGLGLLGQFSSINLGLTGIKGLVSMAAGGKDGDGFKKNVGSIVSRIGNPTPPIDKTQGG